jgi:hypothetical protein
MRGRVVLVLGAPADPEIRWHVLDSRVGVVDNASVVVHGYLLVLRSSGRFRVRRLESEGGKMLGEDHCFNPCMALYDYHASSLPRA